MRIAFKPSADYYGLGLIPKGRYLTNGKRVSWDDGYDLHSETPQRGDKLQIEAEEEFSFADEYPIMGEDDDDDEQALIRAAAWDIASNVGCAYCGKLLNRYAWYSVEDDAVVCGKHKDLLPQAIRISFT